MSDSRQTLDWDSEILKYQAQKKGIKLGDSSVSLSMGEHSLRSNASSSSAAQGPSGPAARSATASMRSKSPPARSMSSHKIPALTDLSPRSESVDRGGKHASASSVGNAIALMSGAGGSGPKPSVSSRAKSPQQESRAVGPLANKMRMGSAGSGVPGGGLPTTRQPITSRAKSPQGSQRHLTSGNTLSDSDSAPSYDDEDEPIAKTTMDPMRRTERQARRNSAILAEAWSERSNRDEKQAIKLSLVTSLDGKPPPAGATSPKAASSLPPNAALTALGLAGNLALSSASRMASGGGTDVSVLSVSRSHSHSKSRGAGTGESYLGRVERCLKIIEENIALILDESQNLSEDVIDEFRAIQSRIANVHQSLEGGEAVLDDTNAVRALLDVDNSRLKWDMENVHVDRYRAAASMSPHNDWQFAEWHMPSFTSELPLPQHSKQIFAIVRLPPENANENMTHTRVSIEPQDKASKCIAQAMSKCKGLSDQNYIFKAEGLDDFMFGETNMFEYETVRHCIRDGVEMKLSLIRRPTPIQPSPKDGVLALEFKEKVKPNVPVLTKSDYTNLEVRGVPFDQLQVIPMSEAHTQFKLKVLGVDSVSLDTCPRLALDPIISHLVVRSTLFHGVSALPDASYSTSLAELTGYPRWNAWSNNPLQNDMKEWKETLISSLPRATRIGFVLMGVNKDGSTPTALAWAAMPLVDEIGRFVSGVYHLRLWSTPGLDAKGKSKKRRDYTVDPNWIFRACTRDNQVWSKSACVLTVQFDEYVVPLVAPLKEPYKEPNATVVGLEWPIKSLSRSQTTQFQTIISCDNLYQLTPDDKALVWMVRHSLTDFPHVLPRFLLSVDWCNADHRNEAYRLLDKWALPSTAVYALELLDAKFPDYRVREYAVNVLRRVRDDELSVYLLQLTQCIKFEPYHDSILVRFLMERALKSPYEIGHPFFWHLKAELHEPFYRERFAVILEEYLSHCGSYANELRNQNIAVQKMQKLAELIVRLKRSNYPDEELTKRYTKELEKLNRDFFLPMGSFRIPFEPKLLATTLMVEKCRYMSSKMIPLWLVFRNADENAPPIFLIFKSGDDLRQDILTIQMLRIMDKVWLSNGLDMKMRPYRCIATGVNEHKKGVGMIEVVINSDTTSGIQLKYGGGAMGALRDEPIDLFLHDHNKGDQLYNRAAENFVCSCAGYCVATFVMGIGDRHNGNIMVTKDGHLFHIDFGHFLGNFKTKFGVNRERAAFVFTPEMAYVMGGKKYKKSEKFAKFLELSTQSYLILRANANLLLTMFALMISAGMPELMLEDDIFYMRDKLCLDVNEKNADKKLREEIDKSLQSTYRRIDNMLHNLKHG